MSDFQKPLVSVLIPAYNHETYIKEAILSVINQTYGYENIQLVVTDDFSTDTTAAILSELASKYNFKLILHTKNIGLPSCLNEMISLSTTDYIASFASDDILVKDRIEKQINILKDNPDIDILVGDGILIDEHGNIIYDYSPHPQCSLINYTFDDLFLRLKPGFAAGTVIIRSDLFQRIGAYDPNFTIEDYYFWLKAAYNNAKIVKCNVPFLFYRVHQKSLSSNSKLMDNEKSKILSIYKLHPKYSKARQNHEIIKLLKWIFISKITVIKHLIKNPMLLFNTKIVRLFVMLLLPTFVFKRKFLENYHRHAAHE